MIGAAVKTFIQKSILAATVFGLSCLPSRSFAQAAPSSYESMDAAIEQSNGQYSEMDISHLSSWGMQQKAWNKPMEHLGEGQTKPGYSRYQWTPDLVLPLRIREGMVTLINFPSWELLDTVWVGDQVAFSTTFAAPNALLVYAEASSGFVGVDSNMVVMGRSGNRYVFYLRSETFNTDRITNAVVDIVVNDANYTPDASGTTPMAAGTVAKGAGGGVSRNGKGGSSAVGKGGTTKTNPAGDGWLDDIPVDPEKLRFDIDVFIPNPDDIEIAPERVWRDEIFTYIDLGPKALSMLQRPIVNLLVQGSEVPVGFRTRGPHSRLIVVEGVGDMVLRNGKRIVCLRIRKDPAFGTEWVSYDPAVQPEYVPAPINPKTSGLNMTGGATIKNTMTSGAPMTAAQAMAGLAQMNCAGCAGASDGYVKRPAAKNLPEKISVEFGSDAEIANLERLWGNISRKNKDLLGKFTPFYSIDASADGDGKDLFRLRIGPVESLKEGNSLCSQLGRRGVTCTVIRTQ